MSTVIGIDASRAISPQRTGTENYSLHLIRALSELDHDYRLRLYYPGGGDPDALPAAHDRLEHRPVSGSRLWTHTSLARELRRDPVDLLFVPAHVIPLYHPPSVVTVHDLGYRHRPADHPARQRLMLGVATRWNVRAARRIIVPSRFTANDLVVHHPEAEPRVDVVRHGVDQAFRPATQTAIDDTLGRHSVAAPYALSVGTIQPRKDYTTLVEAVARYNQRQPDDPLNLVIAGRRGWLVERVLDEIEPFRAAARLTILTDVEDTELPALYSGALAYVQPSRFEGFGMPVLEAMACGAPVVFADATALPEVAGEAGLAFPTGNAAELADRLQVLIGDPNLRLQLSRRGIERAKRLTWHRSASATLAVLERAMAQP
ncbi:MAG TPA: glycosyltransferase family 1 protein [Thermomicrobiales bacterium]|nr:glycosyltransferase family 1 protein [Thermomicrobiales bacterium]